MSRADSIKIINKAIPPTQQLPHQGQPNFHGSSKSLNLLVGYKTVTQYPLQAINAHSQRDVYSLSAYTAELDYSTTPRGSNRDIHSLHLGNGDMINNKAYIPSRQNSIVCAQNPRYSAYGVPHTVLLNQGSAELLEENKTRDIPHYGKLAWFAAFFFFPLGLIALKKHYDTKKYFFQDPEKALAASDVTRFFGTFAILLGIVLYALIVAIRLRMTYENGEGFI